MAVAYAPLCSKHKSNKPEDLKELDVLEEPVIQELAKAYSKTPGQIVLNWHLHLGHVVIPKTTKKERLDENINVLDFKMKE